VPPVGVGEDGGGAAVVPGAAVGPLAEVHVPLHRPVARVHGGAGSRDAQGGWETEGDPLRWESHGTVTDGHRPRERRGGNIEFDDVMHLMENCFGDVRRRLGVLKNRKHSIWNAMH